MFKHLALLICLSSLISNSFPMVFEEDADNCLYLAGTLTCSGERFPVAAKQKKVVCRPLKEVTSDKIQKKNNRTCLSILEFLLEQFEKANPLGFVNIN